MTGGTLSILSNRISYVYDLHGPSLTVDTACSSSLVALHHACEAIRDGRIGSAIVGGINLLLSPFPFLGFCRASMLSRNGRCFAFDERADGYVRGEGGGDHHSEAAGAGAGRWRPHPRRDPWHRGQFRRAHDRPLPAQRGGASRRCSARCTSRPASRRTIWRFSRCTAPARRPGDPIEATAVGRALGQGRRDPLPIGSVKTNIGHLEPASGIAGLLKAALGLQHGVMPPTLYGETPNPNIPFDQLNLRLATAPEPIAADGAAPGSIRSALAAPTDTRCWPRRRLPRSSGRPGKPPTSYCRRWSSRPAPRARCASWRKAGTTRSPGLRPSALRLCCGPPRGVATSTRSGLSPGVKSRRHPGRSLRLPRRRR